MGESFSDLQCSAEKRRSESGAAAVNVLVGAALGPAPACAPAGGGTF